MTSQYIPWDVLAVAAALGVLVAVAGAASGLLAGDYSRALRAAGRVLAVGSLAAILAVTATDGDAAGGLNLRLGQGISDSLSNVNQQLGLINVVGNVVLFVPLGLFLRLRSVLAGEPRRCSAHLCRLVSRSSSSRLVAPPISTTCC